MLLSINSNDEGWLVDDLLSDSDVLLLDEDTSMVNRCSQSELEDDGLESSLKEILNLQLQDVIELLSRFVQKTKSSQSSQQSRTFDLSLLVVFWQGQENSGSLSHSSQNVLKSPDFILVLQTILTADFQFSVDSFLFVGTSWDAGYLAIVSVVSHVSSLLCVYYDVNVLFCFELFVFFEVYFPCWLVKRRSLNLQY